MQALSRSFWANSFARGVNLAWRSKKITHGSSLQSLNPDAARKVPKLREMLDVMPEMAKAAGLCAVQFVLQRDSQILASSPPSKNICGRR